MSQPQIIDVIAKKLPYSDQTFYYVVVDLPVRYVYTRSAVTEQALFARPGQTFFLGRCGDFYNYLAGTDRKGDAFAGSKFDIALDDGTAFHCQGDVWACGRRQDDPPAASVGVATLEELAKCYVFSGGHVTVTALEAWLATNTPSSDYYKYDARPKYVPQGRPRRHRKLAYRLRRAARRAKSMDQNDATRG